MEFEPLVKPTKFTTQQEIIDAIAGVTDRINVLQAREEVTPETLKPIQDELKEVAASVRGIQPKVDALSRQTLEAITTTSGLFTVAEVWEPEPGMAAEHFNLLVRTPQELSISASIRGKADVNSDMASRIREFQALSDTVFLVDEFMAMNEEYRNIGDRPTRMKKLKCWKAYAKVAEEMKAAAGTMFDTQTVDQGAEWIPTMFSSLLHERIRTEVVVSAQFETMPMPSATYKSPLFGADMVAYKVSESLEEGSMNRPTARTFTTKQMTLTAKKLGVRVLMSHEADEDIIISLIPRIISESARALAYGRDRCVLDGDTATPHQDADVTASDDARKTWNGLRKHAIANGVTKDAAAGPIKVRDHWMGVRKLMGRYGSPRDVVAFAGYMGLCELMLMEDGNKNNIFITADKYGGADAAVRTGEIGRYLGVPVILNDAVREDLDATGVNVTGSSNDTGSIILANTRAFANGERRTASIKRLGELYAEYDADAFVGFWRGDFQGWFESTEKAAGLIVNVQ